MLDHRYSRRRLDGFVDGELASDELDRVLSHLISCPECSAEVRWLLRLRASLLAVAVSRQPR